MNNTAPKLNGGTPHTLEDRIVAALNDPAITAAQLAELIAETEQGLVDANTIADRLQQISLDPAASSDLHMAIEGAQRAALVVKRLETVLPRLRSKHQTVAAKERAARFNTLADMVQANRNALLVEFTEAYPQLISKLVDLFERIRAMDREVDHVNGLAPNSESRRLLPTDAARLVAATKLSDLAGQPVWPPPPPAINVDAIAPRLPGGGGDWHNAIAQRDAQRHRDAVRVAEYHNRMLREKEAKESAAAARERGRP